MTLYRKIKDIPGCTQDLDTKESWISFLDSMNLDFDYMVANQWLIPYNEESIEDRVERLENLYRKLVNEV